MKRRSKVSYSAIHVSIPTRLKEDFDETLAFDQSRSAKITRLITRELEGEGTRVSDASSRQLMAALTAREDVDATMKALLVQLLTSSS